MSNPSVVSSSRAVPSPLEETFTRTLTLPLPELFTRRYAAIPAVKSVDQQGEWGTVGQSRVIHLADGGSMKEQLTSVERSRSFGYDLTGFKGPLAPLVDLVQGVYAFETAGTGTRVTWSWTLHPKGRLGALAMPLFGRMWQGYARQALEELERTLV